MITKRNRDFRLIFILIPMYMLKENKEVDITIHNAMISEKNRLEKEIRSIQSKICDLPEGKLVCVHNGKYHKWYQSDGHHLSYIPKKNRKLAEQLAMKKYLSLKQEELVKKRTAVDTYLQQDKVKNEAEKLLALPEYSELLSPSWIPESQELEEWMHAAYQQNLNYPEQLVHKTSSGILVRSKSEAIIAMLLHIHKIPFRYECVLQLGEATLFPDFTLRHPLTGQYFYWEHFGMMDNPTYAKKTFSKLQLYASNEIYPSIQLITTYETKEQPLDSAIVETMIKHYF